MSGWLESVRDLVPAEAFDHALEVARLGGDAADVLANAGHLSPQQLLASLSTFHDLPAVLLHQYEPEDAAVERVGEEVARRLGIMPLFVTRGRLYVAMSDPDNVEAEDYLTQVADLPLERLITTRGNIEQALNRYFLAHSRNARKMEGFTASWASGAAKSAPPTKTGSAPDAPATPPSPAPTAAPPSPAAQAASGGSMHVASRGDGTVGDDEAPAVKIVHHILTSAVRLGASDIHLEPFGDRALLRYRVDGVLREYPAPPLDVMKAVVSRLKIVANLDVSERRLPQDGRASYTVDGRGWDLRLSIIPNLYGESVVVRVLDPGGERKTVADLDFPPDVLERYLRAVKRPHGVVLVTGPTGSGKSTTLYGTLRQVQTLEKKILTLEDPVEAQLEGVTQFQMNPTIGLTFGRVLRSVLRHDPEIILVGEIRDLETAEIAIRASLTGHLLLSTLHTNDAASAATRLMDMGVPSHMVLTSLLGVLAQRLVRRLCTHCQRPFEVTSGLLHSLDLAALPAGATPRESNGCGRCEHSGYKGRTGIYEWLEITPAMRRLGPEEVTAERLVSLASQDGFVQLRERAVDKWLQGVTSASEVVKVTLEA